MSQTGSVQTRSILHTHTHTDTDTDTQTQTHSHLCRPSASIFELSFTPRDPETSLLGVESLKEPDFRGLRGLGLQFWVVFLQKRTLKVPNP